MNLSVFFFISFVSFRWMKISAAFVWINLYARRSREKSLWWWVQGGHNDSSSRKIGKLRRHFFAVRDVGGLSFAPYLLVARSKQSFWGGEIANNNIVVYHNKNCSQFRRPHAACFVLIWQIAPAIRRPIRAYFGLANYRRKGRKAPRSPRLTFLSLSLSISRVRGELKATWTDLAGRRRPLVCERENWNMFKQV